MEENKIDFTDEDIQKAIADIEELVSSAPKKEEKEIEKSTSSEIDALDKQIAELQKQREDIQKSNSQPEELEKNIDTDKIVKSVVSEISSKIDPVVVLIKGFDQTTNSLKEENTKLIELCSKLEKSIEGEIEKSTGLEEKLEKALSAIEEMANSPIGQLKSFKKAAPLEKFEQPDENGKITKSLTVHKRELVNELTKAVEVSENPESMQENIWQVVGLIESGYVADHNFDMIKKSVDNTLGNKYNIIA